jgi:hypothetical protein
MIDITPSQKPDRDPTPEEYGKDDSASVGLRKKRGRIV